MRGNIMSIKEAITDIVIRNAVKYARKDFDRNAPRILSLVEKADVKKVNRSTYAGLHKVMDDPNNNWMRFAKDLICNTDDRRALLLHLSGFPCLYHRRVDRTKSSTLDNHMNAFFSTFSISILFSFVKNFLVAQQPVPFLIIYFHKCDN